MWSRELLIAAALGATSDARYPPAPPTSTPLQPSTPAPHLGMAILGGLAELEIQQRNRDKEREAGGECVRNKNSKQADTHTHTSLLTVKLPSSLSPLFSCED